MDPSQNEDGSRGQESGKHGGQTQENQQSAERRIERRAKIVATVGPASSSEEMLTKLLQAGVDVVRLNLSHGNHDTHLQVIQNLRKVANELRRYVPVFADLMGPRYRLGQIPDGPRQLAEDEIVTIGESGHEGIDLPVEDPDFLSHLKPGERLLLDNGLVELEILAKESDRLRTKVLTAGPVSTRKGINLPDSDLPFTISEKDRADIAFAVEAEVEYIAVSFVGGPQDLRDIRQVVNDAGGSIPLIAKLERARVMETLKETVAEADAVMVARGDLGVEVPVRQVPIFQKQIITAGRRAGKPVIVATQMLESMMEHPRPTRAESSDVANAVFDGADALMLSGETAAGDYPEESVRTMASIIHEAEAYRRSKPAATSLADDAVAGQLSTLVPGADEVLNPERDTHLEIPELIANSAVHATHHLRVRQLVAFSQGGFTARMIARYRPAAPLMVITPELRVARRIQLVWGARAMLMKQEVNHHDEVVKVVDRMLVEAGLADPGDVVIILMGDPIADRPLTNLMRVHRVRDIATK